VQKSDKRRKSVPTFALMGAKIRKSSFYVREGGKTGSADLQATEATKVV
jgi:hypothetical protein